MAPNYGKTFARWREGAAGPWQDYTHHSFVEGLRDGSLPRRAFLHYLVQDYVFLVHFSRAWSLGVVKSETLEEMKVCAGTVDALVNHEMSLHVKICAAEGIDETTLFGATEAVENLAYTRYVMDAGLQGDFLDLMATLAPCVKALLAGSELADSFSWDAHKMMGVPIPCSVILTRNSGVLFDTCTTTDAEETPSYVYHNIGSESYDLGEKSLQGTRKADALKLWFSWKYYGDEGYENKLNYVVELAQYAEQKIEMSPFLEMVFPRQFVNLCFSYKPKAGGNADQLNMRVQQQLMQNGQAYINYTQAKGSTVLLLNVVNPIVMKEDIDDLLDRVIEISQEQDELAMGKT